MEGRRELKHWIGTSEALALHSRLRHVLQRDRHAGPDGTYLVRSLYFDNYQDKVLREKLDGICDRDKFRLRVYGDGLAPVRLEKKSKRAGFCWKRSAWITMPECEALLVGDVSWIADKEGCDPLLSEFRLQYRNSLLRPRTIVEYRREAFIHPAGNVRITIDSRLRSGLASTDFLNPDLPLLAAFEPGQCVLEVKFDHFLPAFVQDLVQLGDTQTSAVSKYALCRSSGD